MNTTSKEGSLFELDGVPKLSQAFPLALQHVVAMIVGCVTPAIIISGAAGLETADRVLLIQASLVVSALATLLQLFPIGKKTGFHLGAGLPVIIGVSFAYVPSMQAIADQGGIPAILGAQIVGGVCAILVGLTIKKIRKFFPPLIAGTVVFTIGLSLYPTAINYMAGGTGSATYGSWQNWLVAIFTLVVVTGLNHFAKGFLKLASILIGMIIGYIFSSFFGMVSFSNVAQAGVFQLPQVLHFGITFEPSACIALGLLFVINSVQAIGDFSATTSGGLDREPTTNELQGAILGYGVSNMVGACLGCLPTATYSQNVGIVATTKVVNRVTLGLAAVIIFIAGVFCSFNNYSICCTGRCNRFRIRIHRHDRYETGYDRRYELPQYLYRRSCSSSWYGCFSGVCVPFRIPCMGNNYFRKISGSYCYISSYYPECNTSKR